jgi:hypothetical protein
VYGYLLRGRWAPDHRKLWWRCQLPRVELAGSAGDRGTGPHKRVRRDHLHHAMGLSLHPRIHGGSCAYREWGVVGRNRACQMPRAWLPLCQPRDSSGQRYAVRAESRTNVLHIRQLQHHSRLRGTPAGSRRAHHGQHRPAELDRQVLQVRRPVPACAARPDRLPGTWWCGPRRRVLT